MKNSVISLTWIPDLESEMYQLSHMLTEQRSLLSSLANTSLLGDKIPSALDSDSVAGTPGEGQEEKEEEERRRKLTAILEKVEGCMVMSELTSYYVCNHINLTIIIIAVVMKYT